MNKSSTDCSDLSLVLRRQIGQLMVLVLNPCKNYQKKERKREMINKNEFCIDFSKQGGQGQVITFKHMRQREWWQTRNLGVRAPSLNISKQILQLSISSNSASRASRAARSTSII